MHKVGLYIFMALLICGNVAVAQDEVIEQQVENSKLKRFEIGGHFTYLRRADANSPDEITIRAGFPAGGSYPPKINEFGFGARFTYNFTKSIGFEVEGNLFPENKKVTPIVGVPIAIVEPGGRKMQALAGPKIGYRGKKIGIFGKARFGIIRYDRYMAADEIGPPGNMYIWGRIWEKPGFFNADVGGVFEYYPSKKTVFRVDVGDSIIYHHKLPPKDINPSITRHNLQISTGFGFRF